MKGFAEETPGSFWTERRLAAAGIALGIAGGLLSRWIGVWLGVGGFAALAGVFALACGGCYLRPLLALSPARVAVGAAAGLVMVAATYLAYPVAAGAVSLVTPQTIDLYRAFQGEPVWLRFALLPAAIAGEDLVWRGLVQSALSRRLGLWAGLLLASALYACTHLSVGSPLLVAVAFACGLYWGALRLWTRSLVPVLVAHLLWDLAVMFFWPLEVVPVR
ncbi:MAG: CPBP family intramembrane glutamic endopeptidase [Armatimonadota bacterium]